MLVFGCYCVCVGFCLGCRYCVLVVCGLFGLCLFVEGMIAFDDVSRFEVG